MSTLTLALLQLARPEPDLSVAVAAGERACRKAASMGADLALFPEMWSNGYTAAAAGRTVFAHPTAWELDTAASAATPANVWRGEPVATDSSYVRHFQKLAEELDMAIALTYLEAWRPAPRNTVSVIDRHGHIVHTYAKVHTCAFALPEAALTPGDTFGTCVLDTAAGDVVIGTMICYDREFPESARALMLAGAEVILTPNACDMEINRLTQFRARAFENATAVAMANYAGHGWGHSIAFDGMAFGPDGSRDMRVVEAGESPGIHLAPIDLDALRAYRRAETMGDAFRRPSAYTALIAGSPRDPFIRVTTDDTPPLR